MTVRLSALPNCMALVPLGTMALGGTLSGGILDPEGSGYEKLRMYPCPPAGRRG